MTQPGILDEAALADIMRAAEETARNNKFWDDYDRVKSDPAMRAFLCQKLLLVASELTEAMEAFRKNADPLSTDESDNALEECCDAVIRLFDLMAHVWGAEEASDMLSEKMRKNADRPPKHGKYF